MIRRVYIDKSNAYSPRNREQDKRKQAEILRDVALDGWVTSR